VTSSETAMDKLVKEVDASDAKVGAKFQVSEAWQTIKSDWERLKTEGPKLTADDAVARHNALIDSIFKLSETIAARSRLYVDPSPWAAVLMQTGTHTVPGALIASGNTRWYAPRASIKGYLGGDDRMALQLYHDEFVDLCDAVGRNLTRASEEARKQVQPVLE